MTSTTNRLTGSAAIAYAESHDLSLSKYADPTDGAREGLTVEQAREIAAGDLGLIYLDVTLRDGLYAAFSDADGTTAIRIRDGKVIAGVDLPVADVIAASNYADACIAGAGDEATLDDMPTVSADEADAICAAYESATGEILYSELVAVCRVGE